MIINMVGDPLVVKVPVIIEVLREAMKENAETHVWDYLLLPVRA